MAVIRSTSSSVNESRQPLVMYSSVVPSWAATSSQKASISRRSAWREVIGRPSPSEWVRDCDDEKPSPPAANGIFVSTPGWDYTSGMGTPRVANLAQDINGSLAPANPVLP